MRILYGVEGNYKDVTDIAKNGDFLHIPSGDLNRSSLLGGDPLPGILKHIKINDTIYDHDQSLNVNFLTNKITNVNANEELRKVHSSSILKYGSFNEEYPEQIMAVKYIKPNNKVLEIGGNIGRNSIVISKLLSDSCSLVVLESDSYIASQLQENRDLNQLSFHIENSAISIRKLCQVGWDTFPYDTEMRPNSKSVMNIGFDRKNND